MSKLTHVTTSLLLPQKSCTGSVHVRRPMSRAKAAAKRAAGISNMGGRAARKKLYSGTNSMHIAKHRLIIPGLALAAASLLVNNHALAETVKLSAKHNVNFLGINVGKVYYGLTINNDQYSISGVGKASPNISLISKAKAYFSSTGQISGYRVIPDSTGLGYKTGRKSGKLDIAFSNGNVDSISAKPKIKYKPDSVPVKPDHLKNVMDPISTLVFPVRNKDVGDGRKVCNRVLPVFDGRTRMNIVLSYKSSGTAAVEGFNGPVHTCAARYQPISGIRPAKKNVKFMKANRDMEVTMARVGDSNVYSLFSFRVRTDKGLATGSAYHFAVK